MQMVSLRHIFPHLWWRWIGSDTDAACTLPRINYVGWFTNSTYVQLLAGRCTDLHEVLNRATSGVITSFSACDKDGNTCVNVKTQSNPSIYWYDFCHKSLKYVPCVQPGRKIPYWMNELRECMSWASQCFLAYRTMTSSIPHFPARSPGYNVSS